MVCLMGTSCSSYLRLRTEEVDNFDEYYLGLNFYSSAITQVLLHYFAFKYRGKKDQKVLYC
jgi:hypothetical protein